MATSKKLKRVESAFVDLPSHQRTEEVFCALAEVAGVEDDERDDSIILQMVKPKRSKRPRTGDEE